MQPWSDVDVHDTHPGSDPPSSMPFHLLLRETSMRRSAAFTFVALTCVASIGSAQASSKKPRAAAQFIGTWRLVSIQADSASRLINRGAHPIGLIYYDATGHMAVQIQPDRRRESWSPT
jgi:Lipocalin-like domain